MAVLIIGFSTGWMVTSGNAEQAASAQSRAAVVAALTPICVAAAQADPKLNVESIRAADSWSRDDLVKDAGWATFAGSDSPNQAVAEACARALMEEKKAEKKAEKT